MSVLTPAAPPLAPPTPAAPAFDTVGDLVRLMDGIPADRILWTPQPGLATEADLIRFLDGEPKRVVELVNGVLVEKPMGWYESRVGHILSHLIESYLDDHDLGICIAADGPFRFQPGVVFLPDVSFVPWSKLPPDRLLPAGAVAAFIPDLTVEVISPSNTRREMARKRAHYFGAGTRLHWQIYPDTCSAVAYTTPDTFTEVGPDGTLDGGDVLPGFQLPLARLFARAGRQSGPAEGTA